VAVILIVDGNSMIAIEAAVISGFGAQRMKSGLFLAPQKRHAFTLDLRSWQRSTMGILARELTELLLQLWVLSWQNKAVAATTPGLLQDGGNHE
jgi:hypothetical protein